MNEETLRELLADAARPAWDDEVRATSALYRGQRRRRTTRATAVGAVAALSLTAGAVFVFQRGAQQQPTQLVLGCSAGAGRAGGTVLPGGVHGVTVAVDNPTSDVLPVSAGVGSVLAFPGRSFVTLPVASHRVSLQCGSGAAVSVQIRDTLAAGACASLPPGDASAIERGTVLDLTRARFRDVSTATVEDTSALGSPVRRVLVHSGSELVAEAVWREMPGEQDWHLESLARCS